MRPIALICVLLLIAPLTAGLRAGGQQSRPKTNVSPASTHAGMRSLDELRVAAEKGDAEAEFTLAGLYYKGEGVQQDYNEAAKWYIKASEQNLWKAQFNLGAMYEDGLGVPQSYKKAVEWFTKAAEQNDPSAQFTLGLIYHNGEGVPQELQARNALVCRSSHARRSGCAI